MLAQSTAVVLAASARLLCKTCQAAPAPSRARDALSGRMQASWYEGWVPAGRTQPGAGSDRQRHPARNYPRTPLFIRSWLTLGFPERCERVRAHCLADADDLAWRQCSCRQALPARCPSRTSCAITDADIAAGKPP